MLEPWEVEGSPWKTKAAFFTWLRGGLRRAIWEKYPLKIKFKESLCEKPPEDYKGRAKSGSRCSLTGEWTPKSYLEVDHIVGNASCRGWDDVLLFIKHLCTLPENMQLVSKDAHKIKSYADKHNISFEEAYIIKMAIDIIKNKKDKQFFEQRSLDIPSNLEKRRKAIIEILFSENNIKKD